MNNLKLRTLFLTCAVILAVDARAGGAPDPAMKAAIQGIDALYVEAKKYEFNKNLKDPTAELNRSCLSPEDENARRYCQERIGSLRSGLQTSIASGKKDLQLRKDWKKAHTK